MSEGAATRVMLDAAERAATAGDFASAYELLRGALRRQEESLGSAHPDLANTLNNLAVVAERTGREKEAEPLYRRAAAIAEAAFPPDHPMVVASRQTLEDFCRARGVSIEAPASDAAIAPQVDAVIAPAAGGRPSPPRRGNAVSRGVGKDRHVRAGQDRHVCARTGGFRSAPEGGRPRPHREPIGESTPRMPHLEGPLFRAPRPKGGNTARGLSQRL